MYYKVYFAVFDMYLLIKFLALNIIFAAKSKVSGFYLRLQKHHKIFETRYWYHFCEIIFQRRFIIDISHIYKLVCRVILRMTFTMIE